MIKAGVGIHTIGAGVMGGEAGVLWSGGEFTVAFYRGVISIPSDVSFI